MNYTQAQIDRANAVSLEDFLRTQGETLKMCIRDRQNGVTEQLKAENQMEWVRQMNACKAQAEEVVKAELIYNCLLYTSHRGYTANT